MRFVLNAFRHHQKTHTTRVMSPSNSSRCAQRLSASSEDSPNATFKLFDHLSVLNAFRHHRKTHPLLARKPLISLVVCSTPFGIIGRLTTCNSELQTLTVRCAQRLSAS